MKSAKLGCITCMALFTLLAVQARLAAQDNRDQKPKHHHYKLIDLGTLGGPQSFGGGLNNQGTASGSADTTTPDPFYPNANPLINVWGPDAFVYHAFETKNGVLVDQGALPGANSSVTSAPTANGLSAGASIVGTIDPLTGWPEENAVLW